MSYIINRQIEKVASSKILKKIWKVGKPEWNTKRIGALREYAMGKKMLWKKPFKGYNRIVKGLESLDKVIPV